VHELVIVLSDLYVSQESPDRDLPPGVALPGLQRVIRFAAYSSIPRGWRAWLSRWLTGSDGDPPATTAAAGVAQSLHHADGTPPAARALAAPAPATALIATPLNLVAGMTSIHLDRRSMLRLTPTDQAALAADFQRVFHDSGFQLQPLDAGDFLMLAPSMSVGDTSEPARLMGASMADSRGAGAANQSLLRLGAEIEMWLHDHAVNDARRRRGEQPLTALWLWGAGPVPPAANVGAPASNAGPPQSDIAFGRDSYVQGLWATARSAKVLSLPQQLVDVFGYPHAQRAVLVIEIGSMLQSNPTWTFFDALEHIDRAFITPAIDGLNRARCERLVVLANDREWTLRARDRLKFWRRTPPGLSGLQ